MLKKTLSALALAAASSTALGFQPLITDDTGTQGSGGNQLELAYTGLKVANEKERAVELVYTRGLSDTLDVFVGIGRQTIDNGCACNTGPVNPSVGAKWRVFENERKTSLAIKPVLITGASEENEAKGMGPGKLSYEISLILTQEASWGAVHANLVAGKEKFRDPLADTKAQQFSVAPVWNLSEQVKLAVDLGTIRAETNGQTAKAKFGEIGAIYSPTAELDFAVGYINEKPDQGETAKTVTAGVTWRFK
jgi:hypothetical protein